MPQLAMQVHHPGSRLMNLQESFVFGPPDTGVLCAFSLPRGNSIYFDSKHRHRISVELSITIPEVESWPLDSFIRPNRV